MLARPARVVLPPKPDQVWESGVGKAEKAKSDVSGEVVAGADSDGAVIRVVDPASDNMPITTSETFLPMVSPPVAPAIVHTLHHIDGEGGIGL
ncbi:hypothetical protein MMRN_p0020 (plasmid) [Mycobacterium marinum]|nr:hypothetical protein MMRN_p0020 [Mycobacterium marinum]